MICKKCKIGQEFKIENVIFKNDSIHTRATCLKCGQGHFIKKDLSVVEYGKTQKQLKVEKQRSISSLYR